MTIQVVEEGLQVVFDSQSCTDNREGFVIVDWCKKQSSGGDDDDDDLPAIQRCTSDDEDSILTRSTADYYSDERRVWFADEVVSTVWTRPYTLKEEVAELFYSTEETQRFRQEYRLERKLLAELSEEDDDDVAAHQDHNTPSTPTSLPTPSSLSFCISRVVVQHNDTVATFTHAPDNASSFDNDSFWSGSITWY